MELPAYQTFMLPFLRMCADDGEHRFRDLVEQLSDEFELTPEQRQELLPSGHQRIVHNRIGWAKTYLRKAGLLEYPRRGSVTITSRGREVRAQNPKAINVKFLKQFEEFGEFQKTTRDKGVSVGPSDGVDIEEASPEESLENAYQSLREDLAGEILGTVKECSPEFFERLVVEVLVAMGYGGSLREAGESVGKSGDEGIDGIIREDRLGLDVIYIQAKRWNDNTVGRPEVQKFVGALQGRRARKGVFITTARFSKEAIEFASNLESKVILIDGHEFARLMIDFDVGVTKKATYEVKRLDADYFSEE